MVGKIPANKNGVREQKKKKKVKTLATALPRVLALFHAHATSQHLAHRHRGNQTRSGTDRACAGTALDAAPPGRLRAMESKRKQNQMSRKID